MAGRGVLNASACLSLFNRDTSAFIPTNLHRKAIAKLFGRGLHHGRGGKTPKTGRTRGSTVWWSEA